VVAERIAGEWRREDRPANCDGNEDFGDVTADGACPHLLSDPECVTPSDKG